MAEERKEKKRKWLEDKTQIMIEIGLRSLFGRDRIDRVRFLKDLLESPDIFTKVTEEILKREESVNKEESIKPIVP